MSSSQQQSEQVAERRDSYTARQTISEAIDAMPRVGLSWGAWIALMLAYFFANYDIAVFAITVPAMRDQLGLTGANLAWPVTCNLIGYSIGAYAFGVIADRLGRQKGLFLTFSALGLGGLATGLAWDGQSLSFFRFLTGCGMGAVLALCSAYIGELAPRNRRGQYLSRIYLIGGILNLIVGLASLPVLAAFPEQGWRYLLVFGAGVLFILPFINKRSLTESPRWLAERGRLYQAADIVHAMQTRVGQGPTHTFIEEDGHGEPAPVKELFKGVLLKRLLIVLGYWFVFYIAMYGYASYLPLLLEGVGVKTTNALLITVLTRVAPLLAGIVVLALVERMERRTLTILGTLIFAAGVACMISGIGDIAATAGALLSTFGIAIMATPAYTYTAEVFPTRNRGTGAAICDGIGHLGGAVAPFFILPILTGFGAVPAGIAMIGLLGLSAIILRMGPRTRNRSLEDIAN